MTLKVAGNHVCESSSYVICRVSAVHLPSHTWTQNPLEKTPSPTEPRLTCTLASASCFLLPRFLLAHMTHARLRGFLLPFPSMCVMYLVHIHSLCGPIAPPPFTFYRPRHLSLAFMPLLLLIPLTNKVEPDDLWFHPYSCK